MSIAPLTSIISTFEISHQHHYHPHDHFKIQTLMNARVMN